MFYHEDCLINGIFVGTYLAVFKEFSNELAAPINLRIINFRLNAVVRISNGVLTANHLVTVK